MIHWIHAGVAKFNDRVASERSCSLSPGVLPLKHPSSPFVYLSTDVNLDVRHLAQCIEGPEKGRDFHTKNPLRVLFDVLMCPVRRLNYDVWVELNER